MSALRLDGLNSGSRSPVRRYRRIEGPSYPLADNRLDMCLESWIVLCLCHHRFGYGDLALRIEPALRLPRMSMQLLNGAMANTLVCSQQRANNRYTHYHRGKPKFLANTQEGPELDDKAAHISFPQNSCRTLEGPPCPGSPSIR